MIKENKQKQGSGVLLKTAAKNALGAIVLTAILLALVTVLIISGVLPSDMADEFVICSVIISTAIAAMRCAKKMGSGVITAGLAVSGIYLAVILAVTIFTPKLVGEGALTLKIIIAAAAGGAFGGATRLYKRTKKSKIRKRI